MTPWSLHFGEVTDQGIRGIDSLRDSGSMTESVDSLYSKHQEQKDRYSSSSVFEFGKATCVREGEKGSGVHTKSDNDKLYYTECQRGE